MRRITATVRAGQLELTEAVNWPDGTQVEVRPLVPSEHPQADKAMKGWPEGFFDQLRQQWGDQPFDRPEQGEIEMREEW